MDYSSLSESQQQLLAQYHQYQQQQQQQQQQQEEQPQLQQQQQQYDPSQTQAYDPTAQAYYPYPQPYQPTASQSHEQYPQQQPYPYYQPDYGTAAAANAYQQTPQPYPNPQLHDASQLIDAAAGAQPQHGAYVPQDGSYQVAPGTAMDVQFVGAMDAAEQAMNGGHGQQHSMQHGGVPVHHHAGRPPYRGGGRRGGGMYRGGGRSGRRPPRPDGGAPPFQGRGHMGRGGGRRFPPPATTAAAPSPHPGTAPAPEQPSAQFAAPAAAPASKSAKAPRLPPQVFWCQVCMVECNSLEILEQHKNGKRHKKTVQRCEDLQKFKKLETESQAMVTTQPENVRVVEENKAATEKYSTKESASESSVAVASQDENKMNLEQQSQTAEQSEVEKVEPTEAPSRKRRVERFDNRRYPPKRNMKFGRGGRHLRPLEPVRSSEVPKELPTRYCALCNIMCDTPAVFECHLAGKKHVSLAKRFPGSQGGYGAIGFYALTPPALPADGNGNHQAQHDSEPEGQEITPKPAEGKEAVMIEHEGGDAVMVEPVGQNPVSEPTGKATIATQDNSAMTSQNVISGAANVCMPVENSVPAPEYGVPPLADSIVLPGLHVKAEENGSRNNELTSGEKE